MVSSLFELKGWMDAVTNERNGIFNRTHRFAGRDAAKRSRLSAAVNPLSISRNSIYGRRRPANASGEKIQKESVSPSKLIWRFLQRSTSIAASQYPSGADFH